MSFETFVLKTHRENLILKIGMPLWLGLFIGWSWISFNCLLGKANPR